ncbi:unnamed protein product [Brugia pahangi]|uniref:Uncharacterized protein n=1 Tax=Brugia pahangi TaxID=6280 RepID=A0A0N4TB15_BRUPA|nr:unnamed protein product [Brugia pahangi]
MVDVSDTTDGGCIRHHRWWMYQTPPMVDVSDTTDGGCIRHHRWWMYQRPPMVDVSETPATLHHVSSSAATSTTTSASSTCKAPFIPECTGVLRWCSHGYVQGGSQYVVHQQQRGGIAYGQSVEQATYDSRFNQQQVQYGQQQYHPTQQY